MDTQDRRPARGSGTLAEARNRQGSNRVADDVLLDAARRCVLSVGIRRTTLAEIARNAGVSRMTLYRRFPDVRSVLAALMTREFRALLHEVSAATGDATSARDRLVRIAVAGVVALDGDPLMRSVLDLDAELLLPYIVRRLGGTQRFAEQVITGLLVQGRQDGSIRTGPDGAQARAVLLLVQSYVFSLRAATGDVDRDALLAEFRHTLDRTLRPS
jgi:AcrR family transcriptional regulator